MQIKLHLKVQNIFPNHHNDNNATKLEIEMDGMFSLKQATNFY